MLRRLILVATLLTLLSLSAGLTLYDDFHYPAEEAAEAEANPVPVVSEIDLATETAVLSLQGTSQTVKPGDLAFEQWHVLAIYAPTEAKDGAGAIALERLFKRWGLIALVTLDGTTNNVVKLRKAVGQLAGIEQPYFNFTGDNPTYFADMAESLDDLPLSLAATLSSDGEVTFAAAATTLTPPRDIVAISNAADVVKFAATHSGRIKCAKRENLDEQTEGGITELTDQHAPFVNNQTVIFDPSDFVPSWPSVYNASKTGLVGGHLNVASIGSFSHNSGFDLVAFSPDEFPSTTPDRADGHAECKFSGPYPNTYVAGFPASCGYQAFATLTEAESACSRTVDCGGVTERSPGSFELRANVTTAPSPCNETSWLVTPASRAKCHIPCQFSGPYTNTYVADYPKRGRIAFSSLAAAEAACSDILDCNGITLRFGSYELRATSTISPSESNETSWLVTPSSKGSCHSLPRISGLQYAPGVFVRLRVQTNSTWLAGDQVQYFKAANDTKPKPIDAATFYRALAIRHTRVEAMFSPAMNISLPGAEGARQADTVRSVLLAATSNYIGNQANYGFGATYWSYGREDNGSLPLVGLSVDMALLDWGICDEATAHIGYYFDNYVKDDGTIDYFTWGTTGDSVGDVGRLSHLYWRASRLCQNSSWSARYLPIAERFGRLMLSERATAEATSAPSGMEGLLLGAPEHAWSSVTNERFYNNNVWVLRGMRELGAYLASAPGANRTLAAALTKDAEVFAQRIAASVASFVVRDSSGKVVFLPPYAEGQATPYANMTENDEASYSNFRFFSESLLADVLPRDVEVALLAMHNGKGGRLGGASRWTDHLDDMPTAGWGYGAVANNDTTAFNSLLYGHMANYQSRGSFHATEQLSFHGEGLYRDFLTWDDPLPPTKALQPRPSSVGSYYGAENDVSYCVVSAVLAARLTRWQLVFEDIYRTGAPTIALARTAPSRWFLPGASFQAQEAPTIYGRVSFSVTTTADAAPDLAILSTYHVTLDNHTAASDWPSFQLKWAPGIVEGTCVSGCEVTAFDLTMGVVTVQPTSLTFQVNATLTPTDSQLPFGERVRLS